MNAQIIAGSTEDTTATLGTEQFINDTQISTVEELDTMAEVLSVNVMESPANEQEPSSNVEESSRYVSMRHGIVWDNDDSTCSSVESNNTPYAEDRSYERKLLELNSKLKNSQLELKLAKYTSRELKSKKKQLKNCERKISSLQKTVDQQNHEIEEHRNKNKELDEKKHEYYLRSTEHEKRVIELTAKLENLKMTNEDLRRTKLKRNAVDEKYNSIQDMYNKSTSNLHKSDKSKLGLDRMEMLVVTLTGVTTNGDDQYRQYHGFRRRLNGMLKAIDNKTNVANGDSVQLWFVTNNAKQDFTDGKEYLKKKANDTIDTTGVKLKMSANNINVVDTPNKVKFDTVEVFREFGKMVGLIELDAKFLQTILVLLQNPVQIVQSTSTSDVHNQKPTKELNILDNIITQQSDKMVQDIYKYVLNDFTRQ